MYQNLWDTANQGQVSTVNAYLKKQTKNPQTI